MGWPRSPICAHVVYMYALLVVDFPRSLNRFINYRTIEQINNGLVFGGKHEAFLLIFDCPVVIVFANAISVPKGPFYQPA